MGSLAVTPILPAATIVSAGLLPIGEALIRATGSDESNRLQEEA